MKKIFFKTSIFSLAGLLISLNVISCASMQSYSNCDVHSSSQLPSLYPSEYAVTLVNTQQIVITTKKEKFEFISLLEIHPRQLSLVALTPVGQKLFQLQYQKKKLDYIGFGMPTSFNPAFLLTDISLIFGKQGSLESCFAQAKIPFSIAVDESSADKKFTRLVNMGAEDKITIEYSIKEIWGGDILFTNHTRDYSIAIKSLGVEPL